MAKHQDAAMLAGLAELNSPSPIVNGWRSANHDIWQRYINHAFVRALGDGSLPPAAFYAYLIQDYLFLIHFSRAWALAAVKTSRVDQLRTITGMLHALINEEIQLHIKLCAEQGISEQQLQAAKEAPENLAYTRYVMDKGLSGDLLDLLAALAPCVFGYYEIACGLGERSQTKTIYQDWIDTYRSDEYKQVCDSVAHLIEEVAAEKLGDKPMQHPRWESLCQCFATASVLEANFWSMGFRLAEPGAKPLGEPALNSEK